jgi:hypothetical protein
MIKTEHLETIDRKNKYEMSNFAMISGFIAYSAGLFSVIRCDRRIAASSLVLWLFPAASLGLINHLERHIPDREMSELLYYYAKKHDLDMDGCYIDYSKDIPYTSFLVEQMEVDSKRVFFEKLPLANFPKQRIGNAVDGYQWLFRQNNQWNPDDNGFTMRITTSPSN